MDSEPRLGIELKICKHVQESKECHANSTRTESRGYIWEPLGMGSFGVVWAGKGARAGAQANDGGRAGFLSLHTS